MLSGSNFATMEGEELSGQLLVGTVYSYRALPQGSDFLYVYLTWLFVVLPVYFGVVSNSKILKKYKLSKNS